MGSATVTTRSSEQKTNKGQRLNLRVSAAEKHLLERAAQASHATATQFILQAALRSAEGILAEETRSVLSPEKWSEFTTLLERPARVIPALAEAAAKPSPFRER